MIKATSSDSHLESWDDIITSPVSSLQFSWRLLLNHLTMFMFGFSLTSRHTRVGETQEIFVQTINRGFNCWQSPTQTHQILIKTFIFLRKPCCWRKFLHQMGLVVIGAWIGASDGFTLGQQIYLDTTFILQLSLWPGQHSAQLSRFEYFFTDNFVIFVVFNYNLANPPFTGV